MNSNTSLLNQVNSKPEGARVVGQVALIPPPPVSSAHEKNFLQALRSFVAAVKEKADTGLIEDTGSLSEAASTLRFIIDERLCDEF